MQLDQKALAAALKAFAPDLFSSNAIEAHQAASPLHIEAARTPERIRVERAITTYLSQAGGGEVGAEPVAWMGYWAGAGSVSSETHITRHLPTMERWADENAEITPLYTAPIPTGASMNEGVRVKKLEWRDYRGDGSLSAKTDFGLLYTVSEAAWGITRDFPNANEVDGIDAAKAAAQADYEQRIRSALEPTDVQ